MIDNIIVKVNGVEKEIIKGLTYKELSKEYQKDYKRPIVIANVNNHLKELHEKIMTNCEIEFIDSTSKIGNRIYLESLIFMNIYAIKQLYGNDANIKVLHSIDKGLYIETNFELTEDKLQEIEHKMNEIKDQNLSIQRLGVTRRDALEYFKKEKRKSKEEQLRYVTSSYVTLYRLGNLYDYFFTKMVPSTNYIDLFATTYLNEHGYVLRYPTIYMDGVVKEYEHHSNMFEVFKETREWSKLMNLENASDLNACVSEGRMNDIMRISETLQNNKLLELAKEIYSNRDKIKIILLAGPSSSGKTTTTNKLKMYLQSFGVTPKMISMDDYFHDRDNTPLDENGKKDFESLRAIDLELFDEQMEDLLNKKEINKPTYNFVIGKKEYNETLKLEENELLLIEGIHCLNSEILTNVSRDKKYKIYLSALTELNLDDHNRVHTTDNRLLRRIIRDHRTRGYGVEKTLEAWSSVRNGEEKYIFPYQDEADCTLNSALIYELGVLKTYVEPLLYSVDDDSIHYIEARRLINFLKAFLPIPSEYVPRDSILREFIGGSYFYEE